MRIHLILAVLHVVSAMTAAHGDHLTVATVALCPGSQRGGKKAWYTPFTLMLNYFKHFTSSTIGHVLSYVIAPRLLSFVGLY